MTTDLARQDDTRSVAVADPEAAAGALAHILATGDLAKLTNEQRVAHYLNLCRSLGLNPLSRPFDWLMLDGKLVLYDNKSCAEQLARQHQLSIKTDWPTASPDGTMIRCRAEAMTPNGRTGTATKYVSAVDRQGNRLPPSLLQNAYMKAETGARRRVTLSMVGLSAPPDLDELKSARRVIVDGRGNIIEHPTDEQRYLAEQPKAARAIGEPIFEDMEIEDSDMPDQRVRPEELEQPKREGPRPTFKASDEDVKRWCGAWFAAVKGLSLDTDEARAVFVREWTKDELEWPDGKRTHSLRTMFARMTSAEAGDFLAHVRALMDDERRNLLADAEEGRGPSGDKVRDSVVLTGGPATAESAEPAF